MEEAQRFFRFVLPGLTFIIELLLYLLISGNICWDQLLERGKGIGIAFSTLIFSGGLGFLFGVFYYTAVWEEICLLRKLINSLKLKAGADLRRVLQMAATNGCFKLFDLSGNEVQATGLSKRGAWRVVTSYLSTRAKISKRIEGAAQRVDKLSDIMNGLGTACLASFLAASSFVIYNFFWLWEWSADRVWISLVSAVVILIIHYHNYKGVVEDYENVVGMIIRSEFGYEHNLKKKEGFEAIRLYVFENDLLKAKRQHQHEQVCGRN